jgi:hypothetical protein
MGGNRQIREASTPGVVVLSSRPDLLYSSCERNGDMKNARHTEGYLLFVMLVLQGYLLCLLGKYYQIKKS